MKTVIILIVAGSAFLLVIITILICSIYKRRKEPGLEYIENVELAPVIPYKSPVPHKTPLKNISEIQSEQTDNNMEISEQTQQLIQPSSSKNLTEIDRSRQIQEIKDEFFGGIYASIESLEEEPDNQKSTQNSKDSNKENSNNNNKTIYKRAAPSIPTVHVKKPPRRSTSMATRTPNIPKRTTSMKLCKN